MHMSNTFSGLFFLSVFIFWMFLHNIYSFNKYFSFCCVPGTRILGTRITAVKRADKNSSSHVVYSVVGVDNISPLGHILPAAYFVNNVPPCSLGLAYFVTFLSPNYSWVVAPEDVWHTKSKILSVGEVCLTHVLVERNRSWTQGVNYTVFLHW